MAKKILPEFLHAGNNSAGKDEAPSPAEIMKSQFDISMAICQQYATFLQNIEHKTELTVREEVMAVADRLVSKHSFGHTFIEDISKFVSGQFSFTRIDLRDALVASTEADEPAIRTMVDDMNKDQVTDLFSTRFANLMKF